MDRQNINNVDGPRGQIGGVEVFHCVDSCAAVRRASHDLQMPHTGRAHSGPVTSTTVQKTTPTSAVETASASLCRERRARYTMDATKFTKKSVNATTADGMW